MHSHWHDVKGRLTLMREALSCSILPEYCTYHVLIVIIRNTRKDIRQLPSGVDLRLICGLCRCNAGSIDVPGLTKPSYQERSSNPASMASWTILIARQKNKDCNPLQPKLGTLSTSHIGREKCPPKFSPRFTCPLHLFPSRKMSPEPEKSISSEKKAEPGASWKTNEKHIVPKNRLAIVR